MTSPLRLLAPVALSCLVVTVAAARQGIVVTLNPTSIQVGQTSQATATGATGVTWTSLSPGIATVNSTSGLVTGVSVGSAVIRAKKGNKTGQATITVTAADPPGNCGEDDSHWHPSVYNGCSTGHEHGDAPPLWVETSGQMPHFNHAGGTPNENVLKHTSFKGFNFMHATNGTELYVIAHNDVHPNGQQTRFHSVQIWARDSQGGVSYVQKWMDFGVSNNTGSQISPNEQCAPFIRPVIAVNFPDCGGLVLENWYENSTHILGWDVGLNTSAIYHGGPQVGTYSSGNLADSATWIPTNNPVFNLNRRIEVTFIRSRFDQNGGPSNVVFYATQFGQIVSGPTDPVCGSSFTVGTRTYTTACLPTYVASTLPHFGFPGNSYENTWSCPNCQLPN